MPLLRFKFYDFSSKKKKQAGFINAPLLIVILILLVSASLFFFKDFILKNSSVISPSSTQNLNEQSKKITEELAEKAKWKKYSNSKYSFELAYPKDGMILTEEGYKGGECGGAIKENAQQSKRIINRFVSEVIKVDNFFEILVLDNFPSIDSYLLALGAKEEYDLEPFASFKADEAVKVIGLKKGREYAVGYPPLAYISHIFRKENRIFLIKHLLAPDNYNGCMNPRFIDPVAHSHLEIKDWDLKEAFKFY